MPYNNAAIPPSDDVTGSTVLPLARVKKILAADEDLGPVSNQASFVIAKGAELFIQHLAQKSFSMAVKGDSKVKRSLTYNDIAYIVARLDHLEFLSDIIPETTTYREYKAKKAREAARNLPGGRGDPLPAGQTTLDSGSKHPVESTERLSNEPVRPPSSHRTGGKDLVFQHYEPNNTRKGDDDRETTTDKDGDVAMA